MSVMGILKTITSVAQSFFARARNRPLRLFRVVQLSPQNFQDQTNDCIRYRIRG